LTRKKFIESYGATANNWRTDWSFVNHDEKLVIFGAWDTHTEGDRCLILHMDWITNKKGRKQPGYTQSIEHIRLINEQGYQLKTFPIIEDLDFVDETDSGRASIKEFIETLTDMSLRFTGDKWYAEGRHKPEHSSKSSTGEAQEFLDIFNLDVGQTEKESLVLSRIGQGKFRKNVIDVWGNGEQCALTGINIREMLIASHIFPWAKCNDNTQRLDGANGILLCSHVDKLFDKHLITFEKQRSRYVVKISNTLDLGLLRSIGIESGLELSIARMHPRTQLRFDEYIVEHNKTFEILN
jgi:hypothetical protein